jgi:hypothetical protein
MNPSKFSRKIKKNALFPSNFEIIGISRISQQFFLQKLEFFFQYFAKVFYLQGKFLVDSTLLQNTGGKFVIFRKNCWEMREIPIISKIPISGDYRFTGVQNRKTINYSFIFSPQSALFR